MIADFPLKNQPPSYLKLASVLLNYQGEGQVTLKRRKNVQIYITRFSDFILGFLVALLVITLGRHAMAGSLPLDRRVNVTIKEEYIKLDLQQRRMEVVLPNPLPLEKLTEREALTNRPFPENNSLVQHADDISPIEQGLEFNRPRAGITKKFDPLNDIEQKIAEDQAYQLYRERYRGALEDLTSRAASEHSNWTPQN